METVLLVIGGAAGLFVGVYGGLKVGERLRGGPDSKYWVVNIAAMFLGMLLVFLGGVTGIGGLYTGGIGLMGGALTGLKYGYGKSVGAWRAVDTVTGSDDLPRE